MTRAERGTAMDALRHDVSLLSDQDIYLFNEGTHYRLAEKLGAHPTTADDGTEGTCFAVWAPNANHVSVIGDFNDWTPGRHDLRARGGSGIWEGFLPGAGRDACYKFHIGSQHRGYRVDKADPFALYAELPPRTGSVVWDLEYDWGDDEWMRARAERNRHDAPISIYEMHLGSWMRVPEDGNRWLTYRELAPRLIEHLRDTGFTHVELLPVMEHPFFGSWGYQTTGYFAPTSRYGTPQDFMAFIDELHQAGYGVILDWVPSHFPTDEHGLAFFDGTHLFEHADVRQGFHPDWSSYIFNYGRNEVRSFLMSSAMHWLRAYHADGLRVDAVASMLYLDYSRKEGEWIPNEYGGRENLEAIGFLRRFNEDIFREHPDVQTYAEESTAWPMVSRPTYVGGLGFGFKWDMGWMHDTLRYLSNDPIHRTYYHNDVTFRALYAFTENYLLPLSHDEVVHGKGSLVGKMPGDEWQRYANLRALYGYMWATPGKKLLFMGGEIGQVGEWAHEGSVDWHVLAYEHHAGVRTLIAHLNATYRGEPALHAWDTDPRGFEWVDASDTDKSVVSFLRHGPEGQVVLVACNFTPVPRHNYLVGVPHEGFWREIVNTDAREYGGSGQGNLGGLDAIPVGTLHGKPFALNLALPPLAIVYLRSEGPR